MKSLSEVVAGDLGWHYRQTADKIRGLVEPLSDEQIWQKPYPYGNSIGHLLLHLTGNLSYYIGTEMGGTGYVRNRPLEFSNASHMPKEALLRNFADAIAMVIETLRKQSDEDWAASFSGKGMEDAKDRLSAFLRCLTHLSHHEGQIMYLIKELERRKGCS
jgi:uncharacterized damage-inducible protein DinB